MHGIDVKRWLLGGVAAGVLIWLLQSASSLLYFDVLRAVLERHGLAPPPDAGGWTLDIAVSLVSGVALVFFYATARPRFGPGPRTAVIVAVALWVAGDLVSLLGSRQVGLYPDAMLVLRAGVGLVEMVVAGLLGAWIYREPWDQPVESR